MTTTNLVLTKTVVLRFFLLLGVLFLSGTTFSQLDTVSVSNISFSQEVEMDTVTNVSDTIDIMSLDIYMDDIDFMGEFIVTVYDSGTDYPLSMIKYTRQEAIDEGIINADVATVQLAYLGASGSYRIETQVRNYQGGNLPVVISNHN